MPASRRAVAMTLAPRSCPSRPTLATSTRTGLFRSLFIIASKIKYFTERVSILIMKYRSFGTTDLLVSEIGFGAWAIGGKASVGDTAIGWGDADDAVSRSAIHAALDAGINFFDTADFYGLGHSESMLGEALEGREAIVATKVGHRGIAGNIIVDYSKQYI